MYYHSIDPLIIQLGTFRFHWYSLTVLLGLLGLWGLAHLVASRHRTEWSREEVNDLVLYTVLGFLLGGRLGFMLFYQLAGFLNRPWILFEVWRGGMSVYGGLIGAAIAFSLFARRSHKDYFQVAELILPLLPVVILTTRVGNFINGELWGRVSNLPWAVIFPRADLQPRHPVQLYMALGEGVLLFLMMWWLLTHKVHRMMLFGAFLLAYGILRFFTEMLREPDIHTGYLAGDWLTIGQLLAFPMAAVGILFIHRALRANEGKPTL